MGSSWKDLAYDTAYNDERNHSKVSNVTDESSQVVLSRTTQLSRLSMNWSGSVISPNQVVFTINYS